MRVPAVTRNEDIHDFAVLVDGKCGRDFALRSTETTHVPEILDADFECWRVEMPDRRMFEMTIAWRCRKSEISNPPNAATREGNEI